MAKLALSSKRLQIDKANARAFVALGIASFVTVFSLIAVKALYAQMKYQNKVIGGQEKAVKQLKSNITAAQQLTDSFKTFNAAPSLIGTPDTNSKVVLDALPSKYDFPAWATSLEKILVSGGYPSNGISGTDDETNQSAASGGAPVEMPFSITTTAPYPSIQNLIGVFERSIRPVNIQTMSLTGNDSSITFNISAKTYYQPESKYSIGTKAEK